MAIVYWCTKTPKTEELRCYCTWIADVFKRPTDGHASGSFEIWLHRKRLRRFYRLGQRQFIERESGKKSKAQCRSDRSVASFTK